VAGSSKYSDSACVAKCQGAQRSYWLTQQVKVKLKNEIKVASKLTSYKIEKNNFLKRFDKITKISSFNTFPKIVK
jgi:hypothetical protein